MSSRAFRAISAHYMGSYLPPYTRIGGKLIFPPPLINHLTTNGKYDVNNKQGYVSHILTTADSKTTYRNMYKVFTVNSNKEAEWASITHGLQFALERNAEIIGIENCDLEVVGTLIVTHKTLKNEYARYYKHKIEKLVSGSAWVGIKWIPQQYNEADILFRQ